MNKPEPVLAVSDSLAVRGLNRKKHTKHTADEFDVSSDKKGYVIYFRCLVCVRLVNIIL